MIIKLAATQCERMKIMTAGTSRMSPIVELRQYDLRPGTRDTLIEIFDRHFVEGQEREGMAVIGQFRDLDNPDSFVWLRGFDDMESRRTALQSFYTGPVWRGQADAANATMIRFDNVLLLRPAWPDGGFHLDVTDRPEPGATSATGGLITANILHVREHAEAFAAWHRVNMLPIIMDSGAEFLAAFVTEPAENTYPSLPVCTDANVFVIFGCFPDAAALDRSRAVLSASPQWAKISKAAASLVEGRPQTLRLSPTARSLLR